MSEFILTIQELTKKFPVGKGQWLTACDCVSLNVHRGEAMGIVGESGCGKSTLVKTVMLMHEATAGKVIFNGQDVTQLTGEAKRQHYRKIQMVFQDPALSFNQKMKVRDIICEPLVNFGLIKSSAIDSKAREMLRLVELPEEFAERYPSNMSGGQRQRIGIARALVLEPEIIVCDEATSALDVSVQSKIMQLLAKLQRVKGITYLFICHDLVLVSSFCKRIAVMYLGNVMEELESCNIKTALHPYTQALMGAVFTVDADKNQKLQTLAGDIPSPLDTPAGCPFQNRCSQCMEICKTTKPMLKQVAYNHRVACHLLEK